MAVYSWGWFVRGERSDKYQPNMKLVWSVLLVLSFLLALLLRWLDPV
jgi:hypothetical protein